MSVVYPLYKQAILTGTALDLSAVNIKAALVDTAVYTYSAAHNFLDDVDVTSEIVATSGNLVTPTVDTAGIFDAADITVSTVSGATIEAIVLYYDTGVASTSRLIAYIDSGTGLPFTPAGSDIDLNWDNGANKIFAL